MQHFVEEGVKESEKWAWSLNNITPSVSALLIIRASNCANVRDENTLWSPITLASSQ